MARRTLCSALLGFAPALLAGLLGGCGIDPDKIADHALVADDQGELVVDGPVSFAVVGNTRPQLPGLDSGKNKMHPTEGVTAAIVEDVAKAAALGGPGFVMLMGDQVRKGATSEYKLMDDALAPLVDGATLNPGNARRIPAGPVAGEHELLGDRWYVGWGGAWPEAGANIGYNRVASWYAFDVVSSGVRWRFMVLDSNKEELGSRWNEQKNWIKNAVKSDHDVMVVFMHRGVWDLGGNALGPNPDPAPAELIEAIDEAVGFPRVRAVFFAGTHTSQVIMPDGPLGTLFVGAGGGGAPAEDLWRWIPASDLGLAEDLSLETTFDLALVKSMDKWNEAQPLSELTIDEAKARGSFTGFTARYRAKEYPVYGWFSVAIDGPQMSILFRQGRWDNSFNAAWRFGWSEDRGWHSL